MPTVNQCIAYIETTGYKLISRCSRYYLFKSDTRLSYCKEIAFTIRELRDAYKGIGF